ncbi:UNVERIFIED_CONTAM: ADP-ribosylation factor-like protein 5 [Sesamum calycinum]|uniref:ADP-ribosylation factor-like protein 5 n=1 Tax=Sesamum calycinum TaxID=2727403 RepID=A0AAW2ITQ5_9LAMI
MWEDLGGWYVRDLVKAWARRRGWPVCVDRHAFALKVWDLGGQDRLRTSWATYYRGTHAVIVDLKDAMTPAEITDALSLHSIKNHDWHIQACCALTGEGLYDGLGWIAQRVAGNLSKTINHVRVNVSVEKLNLVIFASVSAYPQKHYDLCCLLQLITCFQELHLKASVVHGLTLH